MRLTSKVIVAVAVLSSSVAAMAGERVETASGPVELERPERVAVYDIAALDTLTALGVNVVGRPDKVYLPGLSGETEDIPIVGTLFEPDLEALNAAEPDLVVVASRSSGMVEATRRVAPTIDMTLDGADLVAETRRQIADYGRLFGREDAARALTAEIDTAAERARAAAVDKGDALIVLTNGPKISVYGETSRFGWLHRELGIPPAAGDLSAAVHGEAVSFEFIAETDPDWLIVLDRAAAIGSGEAGARATLDNDLVARTSAWSNGRVVYMPAAEFYIAPGGARTLVTLLDAVADGFGVAGPAR